MGRFFLGMACVLVCGTAHAFTNEVTECDRLTAAPYDEQRVALPVETRDIEFDKAIVACRKNIETSPGEPRLIFQYGRAYFAAKLFDQGIVHFRRAAAAGYAAAEFGVGVAYQLGQGTTASLDTAKEWYGRARKNGNLTAAYNLALLQLRNDGFFNEKTTGLAGLQELANKQYMPAQKALADLYASGDGVDRDLRKALAWYRKAAANGLTSAKTYLGAMHKNGWGVERDDRTALRWFRSAAEAGDAQGQIELGFMLADGRGTPQDFVESYKWYILGIARLPAGEKRDGAIKGRNWLQQNMAPGDVAEAQRRARKWNPVK